jgi:4-hydroxythreonine-4-phosphate dehydrogenase
LAVTCGDPGGIGPEVALKAARAMQKIAHVRLIGPRAVWEAARVRGTSALIAEALDTATDVITAGEASRGNGAVSLAALQAAVDAVRAGEADAIVTAPVSKTSLHMAGCDLPGQTEFFAEAFSARVAMMLAGPRLRVVLTSTHLSLRDAIAGLTPERIVTTAEIAHASLSRFLGKAPRLAVCALNPHAGEGGRFGDEESRIIMPAVARARELGVDIHGPFPADTLFWQASHGAYDAVIVLFHDQGLIPLKLLHFDEGVNVTLGLPIVRTSPDHGTAYDIAGRGIAQWTSMRAAMEMAVRFSAPRPRRRTKVKRARKR